MKSLRFKKLDAFATKYSSGNPAAAIYLERLDDLSDAEKLRVAKELKGFVSEVGYVSHGTETDFELCYFSSEREVAFCGHATIAILNDLVANDEALLSKKTLSIATRTARLLVDNRCRDEGCVYISAPPPRYSANRVDAAEIAAALGCGVDRLDPVRPIRIVNGGLETLIVPMAGLTPILSVSPDFDTLQSFCLRIGVDIVLLYSAEVAFHENRYRTRVFATTFGYLEDPATGSGNAAFGYYLLANGLWSGGTFEIEQNGSRNAPNIVHLLARETDSRELQVWFGGGAIARIEGRYNLGDD